MPFRKLEIWSSDCWRMSNWRYRPHNFGFINSVQRKCSLCVFVCQVREMAATTLSGFMQCNFLTMDPSMQTHFEALCKTRLPKKRKREVGSVVDTIPSVGT